MMSKEDANHRMRVSRASDTSSQPRHSRNPPVAAIELADAAECGEGHPGEDARRQCARPSNVFAGVCPGTRSVHTGTRQNRPQFSAANLTNALSWALVAQPSQLAAINAQVRQTRLVRIE
jgi:hypothetical protein